MRIPLIIRASLTRRRFLGGGLALAVGARESAGAKAEAPSLPERGLCAHRGAMSTHPENTLPAFQEAIRLGAHMIEFDVRLTRDGSLALMHDATVDRTTDGRGAVADLTLAELRALDAGLRKDKRFAGTRIPTFEETLEIMPRNVWLNCHLKGGAALGAAVAAVVVRTQRRHQAFLAATADAAKAAREIAPDILICNMERQSETAAYVGQTIAMKAAFIQLLGKGEISGEDMRRLKAGGVRVNYYQVDTPEQIRTLFRAGVDFPLVNDVARFLPVAREFGIEPVKPLAADPSGPK